MKLIIEKENIIIFEGEELTEEDLKLLGDVRTDESFEINLKEKKL